MTITISPITDLPDPPLKTDPTNFASRADTFLDALPDFVVETNAAISELNTITSGLDQGSPIAAWSSVTTYDFPDVVAGSDGATYRCVDTGVLNQDPTTDDGTYWLKISAVLDKFKDYGNAGTSLAIYPDAFDTIKLTCDQSTLALTIPSMTIGRNFVLIIVNGGGCTITWPTGTKWPDATLPDFSTSGTDRVVMQKVGAAEYHAAAAGMAFAVPV